MLLRSSAPWLLRSLAPCGHPLELSREFLLERKDRVHLRLFKILHAGDLVTDIHLDDILESNTPFQRLARLVIIEHAHGEHGVLLFQ